MDKLTPERRNEIAWLFAQHMARKVGIKLSSNTRREILNIAKTLGASEREAQAFFGELIVAITPEVLSGIRVYAPQPQKQKG